jgi:prevent-host-death family protein
MVRVVNLYDAKTQLSRLVDRAAEGEEIVIAKKGVPLAKLVPLPSRGRKRRPAKVLGVTRMAADFDRPDPVIAKLFARD